MSTREGKAGCLAFGLIFLFNLVWLSFVGWLIYLLVEWVTSK